MNTSGAFPANVSIAPRHRAFWGRVTEFEASWFYRLTIIGLVLWWVAYLYPLITVVDIETRLQFRDYGRIARKSIAGDLVRWLGWNVPTCAFVRCGTARSAPIFYLLAGYLFWSAATSLWSIDGVLSIRRFAILSFC